MASSSKTKLSILWLGGIFTEEVMLASRAVSPAANRWQSGLLGGLREEGCDVRILGHKPEPVWPRGPFRMSGSESPVSFTGSHMHFPQVLVGYWNLPQLRASTLACAYLHAFRRLLVDGFRPDCVISYNVYPHTIAIALAAKAQGIPWVSVVADAPGDPAGYERLNAHLSNAAGCVFLSWASYSRWTGIPKLHLDGGVANAPEHELDTPSTGKPKIIFYSGVLNQYGGVDLLLDAFALISNSDVRLWICGKGENSRLNQALKRDSRISFFGCISEQKLHDLSRQAWVMVNPRPTHVPGNENNFPSKVLEYLSYGKPVVSTLTPGIAPEYAPLLVVPVAETPEALAECLCGVLVWSVGKRLAHLRAVSEFLAERKIWGRQAVRLVQFLQVPLRTGTYQ